MAGFNLRMGLGLGAIYNLGGQSSNVFSPLSFFAAGEQGVYFDTNNPATLFEDAAGTIPTALERPVGLMRDLSGRGNHATSSSTARPTLTRRVNLLSNTEQFDAAVWAKTNTTVTANSTTAPDGTLTADTQTHTSTAGVQAQTISLPGTNTVTASIYVKYVNNAWVRFGLTVASWANVQTGELGTIGSGAVVSIAPAGNGWYRITFTETVTTSAVFTVPVACTSNGANGSVNNGQIYVWGADLRPANFGVGLPAYQRVGDTSVNAADYDITGFPAWLRCSGGQSMVTPSINFTGTDKMTVWTGVRKLSDAAVAVFVESSFDWAANGGSFVFTAPDSTGIAGNYLSASRGTASVNTNQFAKSSTTLAPVTNVVSVVHDISGNLSSLRLNGAANGTNGTGSKGSGNFGNYPIYLFARNQASLFFNGLAGPIIVRGAQSSAAEIANAENWINAQQKVY